MPKLIAAFIRHGDYHQLTDTPSAHQPYALNKQGMAQALEAAAQIKQDCMEYTWHIEPHIDSSELLRAWQTAEIIAEYLQEPHGTDKTVVESYDALAERCVGSVANLTLEQIEAVVYQDPRYPDLPPDWKSNSHFRLPFQGAESLLEAGQRVAAHLVKQMQALKNNPDDDTGHDTGNDTLKLFVGHGASIRHAAYHLGILSFEQIARLSMYHASPVYFEFHSSGQWQHIAGEWKVRKAKEARLD